jgi:DNA-binding SARP family transcriptional activator
VRDDPYAGYLDPVTAHIDTLAQGSVWRQAVRGGRTTWRKVMMRVQPMSSESVDPDAAGHRFQLRLLDGFHLDCDGRLLRLPRSVCRLLAFLGVRGRTGRVEIAGTLWPEVVETRAHASLRTLLWRLHRVVPAPLVTGREALALSPAVSVDVSAFAAAAREVMTGGDVPIDRAPALLTVMGVLLPGWYDDWVLYERERLRQLHLHALEALAARLTRARRHAEAIEAALAAIRLEPLRESATRALITAHLAENNIVEAVRRYETFRDELTSELGAQPTEDLEQLVQSGLGRQQAAGQRFPRRPARRRWAAT